MVMWCSWELIGTAAGVDRGVVERKLAEDGIEAQHCLCDELTVVVKAVFVLCKT